MRKQAHPASILVDKGLKVQYLAVQLAPESLQTAAAILGQALTLRRHEHFDHSYWFIQGLIEDHLRHHAERLCGAL